MSTNQKVMGSILNPSSLHVKVSLTVNVRLKHFRERLTKLWSKRVLSTQSSV